MPATNTFFDVADVEGSAVNAFLVTPDDANDLAFVTRGVRISVAGTLKVTMLGGGTLVYPSGALAAGVCHPMRVTRIWSTSTTATGIVGEY